MRYCASNVLDDENILRPASDSASCSLSTAFPMTEIILEKTGKCMVFPNFVLAVYNRLISSILSFQLINSKG